MNLPELLSLPYWNSLAKAHLPEIIMVLTAALVVLADRYVRRLVNKYTSGRGAVARFFVFLLICSIGYAGLTLGTAWALRSGLTLEGGAYMAPCVLGILLLVAVEAQRQKQM